VLPEPVRPGYIDCYSAQFLPGDPLAVAAYADVLRPSFDFEIPAAAAGQPFAAHAEVYFLPDIIVSRAQSTASRLVRTAETIAARGTDQILVVCYTSGYFDLTSAGQTRRVAAGEIAFIDLSQPVTIEAPAVDNVGLAVSRRQLESRVALLNRAHGFVRPDDALARLLRSTIETIAATAPSLTVGDARGVAEALLHLVAACLEPLSRAFAETGSNTASLLTLKTYVEEHLLEPGLGPQSLLDRFSITRSTLYRLFEPLGGVTGFIAQRKLQLAFRRLSDARYPREPVSRLAGELGFSHPSAFARAFKEAFGLSPSQVQGLKAQSREQDIPLMTSVEPMQYFRPLDPV
jgi:AraC-like DNA-binding protein